MDPHQLSRAELEYELNMRGLYNQAGTSRTRAITLQDRMATEALAGTQYTDSPWPPNQDLPLIRESINALNDLLVNTRDVRMVLPLLRSRLSHLWARINRIPANEEYANEVENVRAAIRAVSTRVNAEAVAANQALERTNASLPLRDTLGNAPPNRSNIFPLSSHDLTRLQPRRMQVNLVNMRMNAPLHSTGLGMDHAPLARPQIENDNVGNDQDTNVANDPEDTQYREPVLNDETEEPGAIGGREMELSPINLDFPGNIEPERPQGAIPRRPNPLPPLPRNPLEDLPPLTIPPQEGQCMLPRRHVQPRPNERFGSNEMWPPTRQPTDRNIRPLRTEQDNADVW